MIGMQNETFEYSRIQQHVIASEHANGLSTLLIRLIEIAVLRVEKMQWKNKANYDTPRRYARS